jgi:hypothetical protein
LGNPVADWESGRRCPTACEALRACEVAGIDVVDAFARFHRVTLPRAGSSFALGPWLAEINGSVSATELAGRAGRSRQQVGRWLNGRARPRLNDFLCLVDAITGRVCDLIAALVPIEQVPSVEKDYKQRLAARQLAHEEPWTEAILRCIETESYCTRATHEPGAIARVLGIDGEIELRCLQKLEQTGVIVRRGAHYEPARSLTVDTRAIPQLKAHWCRVAESRLGSPQPKDISCYNVMCASEEDIERIRQLLLATFREIRTIVEHTPREAAVALVNIQLVNFTA